MTSAAFYSQESNRERAASDSVMTQTEEENVSGSPAAAAVGDSLYFHLIKTKGCIKLAQWTQVHFKRHDSDTMTR